MLILVISMNLIEHPAIIKNKTKKFPIAPENTKLFLIILVSIRKKLNPILIPKLKYWYVIGVIRKII